MSGPQRHHYDVVVIGAGLAGLTCGALLAKQGMQVLVVERRPSPGGVCHSFEREGFTLDVGSHLLSGCGPGWPVHRVLQSLGTEDQVEFLRVEPLARTVFPDWTVDTPSNGQDFISNMTEHSPEDAPRLGQLFREMLQMYQEVDQLPHTFSIWKYLKVPVNQPVFVKYPSKTYQEAMDDFLLDPRVKAAVASLWVYFGLPPSRISAVFWTVVMMTYFLGGGYYPKGGLSRLAAAMAAGLERQGGELLLSTEARSIILKGNRVSAVQLQDVSSRWTPEGHIAERGEVGETFTIEADKVVSAGDAVHTLTHLVGPEHLPNGYAKKLLRMEPSLSLVKVSLGVEMDLPAAGFDRHDTVFYDTYDMDRVFDQMASALPDAPCDVTVPSLTDPSLAPPGSHCVYLWNYAPFDAASDWEEEGKRTAERFITWMEGRVPGFRNAIRVQSVMTPQTMQQYALTVGGAPYGWAFTPAQMGFNRLQPRTPVKGLYLTGHWTTPGAGVAGVVMSGERTAEIVITREGFTLWRKSA